MTDESKIDPNSESLVAESLVPERLVRRAQKGERACLDLLWRQHRRYVASILLAHRSSREEEIEDLLQEVAVILVRRIGDLDSPGAFRGWLRTIAINVVRSRRRKRATGPSAVSIESPAARAQLVSEDPLIESFEQSDETEQVLSALAELPEDQREVLVLRSFEGISQREIARRLELPETTVESRLVRARRKLREAVHRRRHESTSMSGDDSSVRLLPEEPK